MSNILLGGSIGTTGTPILGTVDIVLSDANHTLSVSEYTNNFINVSGTLTTSRDIILPLVKGQCFIINNGTTGGFAIRAIGATGTGETVNNGNRLLVICDGSNYLTISIIDSVGGDLGDFLPNPTVRKLWTVSIPQVNPSSPTSTTGFVIGNVLQVTNVTANNQALGYAALNLGTGSASTNTSGILPNARQAPQALTGDLSGFTNSSGNSFNSNPYGAIVAKIQQTPIQALTLTSQQDGYVLTYNFSSNQWQAQSSLTGASLSGDVTGQPGTNVLTKLQGKVLTITSPVNGHVLTYNSISQTWTNQDHSLAGDLSGTLSNGSVIKLRGNPVALQTLGTAQDGYVLTWSNSSGNWVASITASGSLPGGTATGDLSGFYPGPTVIAINGTSVPSTPGTNRVLTATSSSSSVWQLVTESNIQPGTITNASISTGAAISGLKISPGFGPQVIGTSAGISATGGNITGLAFGVNNGTTIPLITSGTGIPATTTITGSLFLRTDGTSTAALYSYQSGAWSPVGASAAGSAGGDLSGNYPNPTVIAIQKNPIDNTLLSSIQDGYVLTWNNSTTRWVAKPSTGGGSSITFGGDLSGTSSSQTVLKINGAGVPIAGALIPGNVLQVANIIGGSSLTYGAINLAGGSSFVNGILPIGNQASQTMAGDVTGTTAISTVTKIQGVSVTITAPLDGYVLRYSAGASALIYSPIFLGAGSNYVSGVLPTINQASQNMGGDVSGTTASSNVIKLQNISVLAGTPIDGYVLTYVAANTRWESKPTASGSFVAGGDLSGTSSSQNVIAINGGSVPASSGGAVGNALYITAANTFSYSALNLGGGSGYVIGALPTVNQVDQAMGGDISGTTGSTTVLKIHGATVPVAGTLNTGNGLYVSGSSALSYSALNLGGGSGFITGLLPTANQVVQTMLGDVTGTTGAAVVTKLQTIPVLAGTPGDGYVLTYSAGNSDWEAKPSGGGPPTGIASGDLSASYPNPTVAKIQNIPILAGTPSDGYFLQYNASNTRWEAAAGPSGSFSAAGDLSGTSSTQTVTGIQNIPVAAGTPTDGYVLTYVAGSSDLEFKPVIASPSNVDFYNGGTLVASRPAISVIGGTATFTDDVINNRVTLTVTSSSGTSDHVDFTGYGIIQSEFAEVGQYITNARFKATYDFSPVSVTLDDNDGNPTKDVSGTPNAFSSDGYFQKNTFGQSVTFTLTADGYIGTFPLTWVQRNYFGTGVAGMNTAVFISTLNSEVTDSIESLFSVNAGSAEKIYYAHRTAYGTPTFFANGFEGGFTTVSTMISLTNPYGFTENYTLYESDNVGLGITSVEVF